MRKLASGASAIPGVYNPVADPKAVVTHGNARFTVLTPQLIRMEWAADGKFEDHASLVFLNRKLAGAELHASRQPAQQLVIKTERSGIALHADCRFKRQVHC